MPLLTIIGFFSSSPFRGIHSLQVANGTNVVGTAIVSISQEDVTSSADSEAMVSYIKASSSALSSTNKTSGDLLNQAVLVASLITNLPRSNVTSNVTASLPALRNQAADVILNTSSILIKTASDSMRNLSDPSLGNSTNSNSTSNSTIQPEVDPNKILNALAVINSLPVASNSTNGASGALDALRVSKSAQVLAQLLAYAQSQRTGNTTANGTDSATALDKGKTGATLDLEAVVAAAVRLLDAMALNVRLSSADVAANRTSAPQSSGNSDSSSTTAESGGVGQSVMDAAEAAARVSAASGSACAAGPSLTTLDRVRLYVANTADADAKGKAGDGYLKLSRSDGRISAEGGCIVQWMVRVDVDFNQTTFDYRGYASIPSFSIFFFFFFCPKGVLVAAVLNFDNLLLLFFFFSSGLGTMLLHPVSRRWDSSAQMAHRCKRLDIQWFRTKRRQGTRSPFVRSGTKPSRVGISVHFESLWSQTGA
jgi:hypothetical protein